MNRNISLVILVVALFMGLSAAFLARQWVASHSASATASGSMGTILVAATELPFGTQLTANNVSQIPWPTGSIPEGAFTSVDSLVKDGARLVLSPFVRHEPIVITKVTLPGEPASLSTTIDDGMRAVTVSVDEVRGVAGFVSPGDYVDILLTPNRSDGSYTEAILQRVKVLAIDQHSERREEKPVIARAVTFELSTEDSLKLVLATNIGRLSLVLRRASETNSAPEQRVTEQDLYPERKAPIAAADPAPQPQAPRATEVVSRQVAVFRDMKQQNYSVPLSSPSRYDLDTAATANLATVNARTPRQARETFDN